MATGAIVPPEKFNFQKPEEWMRWIRRFERYLSVSKTTGDEDKVDTLIYCLGSQAEDILPIFGLTEDEMKVYKTVKDKFNKHFKVRKNVIFERARFNRRVQQEGETIESFITDLYALIETCEYGELHEDFLRDRIVVGIRDTNLSESLQMDDKLTLKTTLEKVRSKELIKKQSSLLQDIPAAARADTVRRQSQPQKVNNAKYGKKDKKCQRCGLQSHKREECPARESRCRKCNLVGHWQKMCRTKGSSVKQVEAENTESEFLGTVTVSEVRDINWDINLLVNNKPLTFKIDCGADVTVVSEKDYRNVASNIPLSKPDKVLLGANSQPLNVIGVLQCEVANGQKDRCIQKLYIVDKLKTPLLGKPAISSLKILKRTNEVNTCPNDVLKESPERAGYRAKIKDMFPKLFNGLGQMEGEYRVKLSPNCKPVAISAPRRIAQPLLPKVKDCLDKMEADGVIRKLQENEVSPWMSGMVVVPKPGGKVRVCVDLTQLNKNVIRPRYQLPTVDEVLCKLGDGKVFTKLDANSGFFQCNLAEESQLLTSFLTPFAAYCYRKLPFGITSGREFYQKKINGIIGNMKNTTGLIDDICVYSPDKASHEQYLFPVLKKLQDAGVTLNMDKCEFMKTTISFVGHEIGAEGIRADPRKVLALKGMSTPTNVSELRRFLGMANQLGKFCQRLAECTQPLRALLSKKNQWHWGAAQDEAFQKVKEELCSSSVLAKYNPSNETKIRSDSSKYGYGAVLLQRSGINEEFKPVFYASKALSLAEQNYSIIEKEAGAMAWACKKFDQFILGMENLKLETDQKPLVSLLGKKPLDQLPPRIVRFRLSMMRYKYTISHVPGKDMHTSDCLSRAPIKDSQPSILHEQATEYIQAVVGNLPCTDHKLEQIKQLQQDDEITLKLMQYAKEGWPVKTEIPGALVAYYQFRDEFSVHNGLLLKNDRIVIPTCMRLEILDRIHEGHLGIDKCRQRAIQSVWWPGLSKQIEHLVSNCTTCVKHRHQAAEPLKPISLPDRPWQKAAADLCELSGHNYLVVVDYYSRYVEMAKLGDTRATTVINHLKSIMARHGIVEVLMTDNGPQFANSEMNVFSREYGFVHITSSPKYPQSNGMAEQAVKTLKGLLKKNKDPYLALLTYRATPIHNGYSPAELCMGRRLRTTLPVAPHTLMPQQELPVREKEVTYKEKMKTNFDLRHLARDLPVLKQGDKVIIKDTNKEATVEGPAENAPRSYLATTPTGTFRRNRRSLVKIPDVQTNEQTNGTQTNGQTNTLRRSGRVSKPPERLNTPEIQPVKIF